MTAAPSTKALVAFYDGDTRHPLGRLLKKGFGHCFCAFQADGFWILADGQDGLPSIKVIAAADYDLAAFYRNEGLTVIELEHGTKPLRRLLMPWNCVGLVKAALSIRSRAVTPYGLYRYLKRNER